MNQTETIRKIVGDLHALGIKKGDAVFTHSSMRSMGAVEGGCDTVIRGMKETVSEDGTLLFPAFTFDVCTKPPYFFSYQDSRCCVGALPEFFRRLLHFGLDGFFDFVCGSLLDGERVRKGEVIRHVLTQMQIPPEEAVMVGDREHDVLGAAEAGIPCIGVLYGYGGRLELEKAGAADIAENLEDLQKMLIDFRQNR